MITLNRRSISIEKGNTVFVPARSLRSAAHTLLSCMLLLQVQRKGRPGDEMGFEPGSISKETAEMRADLGKQANFWDMQVGRLAGLLSLQAGYCCCCTARHALCRQEVPILRTAPCPEPDMDPCYYYGY